MNNINLTLNEGGSLLLGAGLAKVVDDYVVGLILIGAGAILKITVAVLKKKDIIVGAKKK